VLCAIEVQEAVGKENADRPAGEQMWFRIGVHVGDIMVRGGNLFGDAVNIAARLEALAEPGGICVSGTVQDQGGLPVNSGKSIIRRRSAPSRTALLGDVGPGRIIQAIDLVHL
jgi:class 3 adenylate cyclase